MIPSVSQDAGQQLVNGSQAEAYADHFIAVHLSELSDPTDLKLQALEQTSIQGTTLILAVIMAILMGLGFRPARRTAPEEGLVTPRAEPRRRRRRSEVVSARPSSLAYPPRGPKQRLRGGFVGGGIAAAGTLLALRDLEGERVSLRLR